MKISCKNKNINLLAAKVEVYHQERTTKKYLYQSGLPAMSQMSICFWANLGKDDDNRDDDFLLSIANKGLLLTFYSLWLNL